MTGMQSGNCCIMTKHQMQSFVFCCHKAEQESKLKSTTGDLSFISKCFINWKDATEAFIKKDEKSKCHQDASQALTVLPATINSICTPKV